LTPAPQRTEPLLREWPEQPDLLALQAGNPARYPGLFHTRGTAGWDILFAFPQSITQLHSADELPLLKQHPAMQIRPAAGMSADPALPFCGGWLVAFSYELGAALEPHVGQVAAQDFPLAWLARIPAAILVNQDQGRCVLLAEADQPGLLDLLAHDLLHAPPALPDMPGMAEQEEDEPGQFLLGVARIQDYIRAGDVFQVNLSRGWQARFEADVPPAALFGRLMHCNPAPFSALLQADGWAIVSSSPERLVRVGDGGEIETRPIAGTHPRSESADEDADLRQRLQGHPKERAEHVMLVDLERNDLGRVCRPGSVEVSALMEISSYRHVHHIESTIKGQLRPGVSVFDILRATFPGGTITGCPKVRTMQIIRELEPAPRACYTGSVGYINHDGRLDLNILIRSFLVRGAGVSFRAGAGIVADSVAARELDETRAKARGLLRALEAA